MFSEIFFVLVAKLVFVKWTVGFRLYGVIGFFKGNLIFGGLDFLYLRGL